MGTTLKTKVSRSSRASGESPSRNSRKPCITQELLVSPGWTRAVTTTARLARPASRPADGDVTVPALKTRLKLQGGVLHPARANSAGLDWASAPPHTSTGEVGGLCGCKVREHGDVRIPSPRPGEPLWSFDPHKKKTPPAWVSSLAPWAGRTARALLAPILSERISTGYQPTG
ncbi:hypothetical protein JZ751_011535 [Albula glossodonta]|uniref:Uncharacterized protein n=1 Tax=Albula glossodonta TaxID=121402 RepID=A0A8T2N0R8_9TELE|nr:hypothetical protein JZ751_011535 [Albula glossodonta]